MRIFVVILLSLFLVGCFEDEAPPPRREPVIERTETKPSPTPEATIPIIAPVYEEPEPEVEEPEVPPLHFYDSVKIDDENKFFPNCVGTVVGMSTDNLVLYKVRIDRCGGKSISNDGLTFDFYRSELQ